MQGPDESECPCESDPVGPALLKRTVQSCRGPLFNYTKCEPGLLDTWDNEQVEKQVESLGVGVQMQHSAHQPLLPISTSAEFGLHFPEQESSANRGLFACKAQGTFLHSPM